MSMIRIKSTAVGNCEVIHEASGETLHTDLPVEYGGSGRSFSATDLLAAALGCCIATNIDEVADRHSIPLDALDIRVRKELNQKPKEISLLQVSVAINISVPEDLRRRIERAASSCLVHRSLHPDLAVNIEVNSL